MIYTLTLIPRVPSGVGCRVPQTTRVVYAATAACSCNTTRLECVEQRRNCDGHEDCTDGSDEWDCGMFSTNPRQRQLGTRLTNLLLYCMCMYDCSAFLHAHFGVVVVKQNRWRRSGRHRFDVLGPFVPEATGRSDR